MATLKFAVHIGATELLAVLREGRTMAEFTSLAAAAAIVLDDLLWWTRALNAARTAEIQDDEGLPSVRCVRLAGTRR